jgi:hypothetical protein
MNKFVLLCVVAVGLSGCHASHATPDPQLYANKGIVVSEPTCQDTVCKAVIKIDEDVWHYDAIKGPVKRSDVVYKTCRYDTRREVCSALWTSQPYVFYPETTAEGTTP